MSLQSLPAPITKTDLILLIFVVIFLYLLLFKLPFYPYYYEGDHLIFLENADRMLHGEHIYRDFFQFTFPGAQVVYYLLFLVFGPHYWLSGIVALITGSAAFWVTLRISKNIIPGSFAYLPPMVFAFFGLRWFGLVSGSHRTMSALFIWLAILILLRGSTRLHLVMAAAFCAVSSFFVQQTGLAAVIGIVLFVVIDNLGRGWKWSDVLSRLSILFVSFFAILGLLCSYFFASAGISMLIAPSTSIRPSCRTG